MMAQCWRRGRRAGARPLRRIRALPGALCAAPGGPVSCSKGDTLRGYCRSSLFGIEKSERMMRVAWTDLMLHELGGINLVCADALGSASRFPSHALGTFDVVITQPAVWQCAARRRHQAAGRLPDRRWPRHHAGRGAGLRAGGPISAARRAHRHRAARRSAGQPAHRGDPTLGCSESVVTRHRQLAAGDLHSLRRQREDERGLRPPPAPRESQDDKSQVLLVRIDQVGYDASGRTTAQSDIPSVVTEMNSFFARQGW